MCLMCSLEKVNHFNHTANDLHQEINEVARHMMSTSIGESLMITDDGSEAVYKRRLAHHARSLKAVRETMKTRRALLTQDDAAEGDDESEEALGFDPDDMGDDDTPVPGDDDVSDEEEIVFENKSTGRNRTKRLRVGANLWDALFKYQQTAVKWLWELHLQQAGGILGDEMGLGKTVQIISFLAGLHRSELLKGAILVVCPVTLMSQWVREFHKWAPALRVVAMHSSGTWQGTDRKSLLKSIDDVNTVVLTTYRASQDEILTNADIIKFHYVILDEGHNIRNPGSLSSKAVKKFPTPHRLVLTGSPLQNKLSELWALFDFIYPGKLGDLPTFTKAVEGPINQGGFQFASPKQIAVAYECCVTLRDLTAPYLLRRMKKDVLTLPDKTEQVLFCRLALPQVVAYTQYLKSKEMKEIFLQQDRARARIVRKEGGYMKGEASYRHAAMNDDQDDRTLTGPVAMQGERSESGVRSLTAIQTLRKICNHPQLFKNEDEDGNAMAIDVNSAGKMKVIHSLLTKWKEQGHKVLIFSQSLGMPFPPT